MIASCRRSSLSLLRVLAAVVGSASCTQGQAVSWSVSLASIEGPVHALVIERRSGGCAGPVADRWVQAADEAPREIAVAPGEHGFSVTVVDDACRIVGSGCTSARIEPGARPFVVEAVPRGPLACTGAADCPVDSCRADAGLDAATSAGDASADARADMSPDANVDAYDECADCVARGGECCGALDGLCCTGSLICCNGEVCGRTGMCPDPR